MLILSGAAREVLQVRRGAQGRSGFGHSLAFVGDVDADGATDVSVGYERQACTEVGSGESGEVHLRFSRNHTDIHAFGDCDGDDHSDVLLAHSGGLGVR